MELNRTLATTKLMKLYEARLREWNRKKKEYYIEGGNEEWVICFYAANKDQFGIGWCNKYELPETKKIYKFDTIKTFKPQKEEEAIKYGLVWIEYVLGQMNDEEFSKYAKELDINDGYAILNQGIVLQKKNGKGVGYPR